MSATFPPLRAVERAAMRVVLPVLDRYATKPLRVVDEEISVRLGPSLIGEDPVPEFIVHHPAVWRSIGRGGIQSLGSTYEDGWWSTNDLEGVLSFFVSLLAVLPSTSAIDPISRRVRPTRAPWAGLGADDPQVLAHVLDKTMFHGTGRFFDETTDLYTASLGRFSQICERLELDGDSRVCELGTGWGAFSLYASRTRGCSVVTVTNSDLAASFAKKRLANAGLADAVEVRVGTPTSISGTFDTVVSIDADDVWGNAPMVTTNVDRLLDPSGLALIQMRVLENASLDRTFFGPSHPTLSRITGSVASLRCRVVATTELLDDDQRTRRGRIANLESNHDDMERAGFSGPIYRSRMFGLVRDLVLTEQLGIRSTQVVLAGADRPVVP